MSPILGKENEQELVLESVYPAAARHKRVKDLSRLKLSVFNPLDSNETCVTTFGRSRFVYKRRERAAKFSTLTKNSTLDLQMNIFKKILHKIRNKQADKPKQEPVILGYFSGHSTPQISVQREHSMYRVNAGYLSEAEINAHKVPQNGRASMFAGAAPPTCLGSPIQFARPGAGGFPETGLDSSQPFRAADAMYFNLQRLEMTGVVRDSNVVLIFCYNFATILFCYRNFDRNARPL